MTKFFTKKDWENSIPMDFDTEGVWEPSSVNECIKFSKYEKDSQFKPHKDGLWAPSNNKATIHSILIYLNDDFEGGNTNFIKISDTNFTKTFDTNFTMTSDTIYYKNLIQLLP